MYKDRLLRFGFELVEYIASLYNCDVEIIDNTEKSEQQELVEDLVQIITVFSCKLQGKRANKARKLVKEISYSLFVVPNHLFVYYLKPYNNQW